MEEAADPALAVAAEEDEAVAVVVAAELVERHAEAALVLPVAPAPADVLEFGQLALRELVEKGATSGGALLPRTRDVLPHVADRPALERERVRVDDRLVAEVERAQPKLRPERKQAFARTDRRETQPARLGEGPQLLQQAGQCLVRADGVA